MIEDDGSVVRVTDPGSTTSQPHICTQLMPVQLQLVVVRRRAGGLQTTVSPFLAPSPGDCAGPPGLSLSEFTLPARRLPGRTEAYDLAGTETFGSGPYAVTINSTIRARRPAGTGNGLSGSSGAGSSGPVTSLKPHKGLVENVSIQYRIATAGGTVTTTFAGRPSPLCVPFDACGTSGTITDALSVVGTRFEFDAQRVVTRRVSRRGVLADLRSGRLPLQDSGVLIADTLSANVDWSAGSACTDRLRQLNALFVNADESQHHSNVVFSVATDQIEDPFRTACPGPGTTDVLGSSSALGQEVLPVRALGRKSLRIVLAAGGRFVAGSYAGSRGGGMTLGLKLVRLRAGTKTEDVFPGLP